MLSFSLLGLAVEPELLPLQISAIALVFFFPLQGALLSLHLLTQVGRVAPTPAGMQTHPAHLPSPPSTRRRALGDPKLGIHNPSPAAPV